MGFSSSEAKIITDKAIDHDLIQKGCGHLVYKLSQRHNTSLREAGELLMNDEGWHELEQSFKEAQ
jgi:D-ornithine 4,5-aminomutase subunit alpha